MSFPFFSDLSFARDRPPVFVVELERSGFDLAEELGLVLIVEWGVAAKQDVNDHADTPHIHRLRARDGEREAATSLGLNVLRKQKLLRPFPKEGTKNEGKGREDVR